MATVTMTINQWGMAVVRTLGNVSPSVQIQVFMSAWIQQEGGGGKYISGSTNRCDGNGLNTCYQLSTSKHCPSVSKKYCVQTYLSNNDGIYANAQALRDGRYPHLLQALVTNDADSLGFNGHTMSDDIAGDLSVWVSGSRTARLDYAATVARIAGANPSKKNTQSTSTDGGNTVASSSGNTPSSNNNNPLSFLANLIGGPTLAWIQNPMRVIKMIVGLLCIGASIFLLVTPEAAQSVSKVAPFLA